MINCFFFDLLHVNREVWEDFSGLITRIKAKFSTVTVPEEVVKMAKTVRFTKNVCGSRFQALTENFHKDLDKWFVDNQFPKLEEKAWETVANDKLQSLKNMTVACLDRIGTQVCSILHTHCEVITMVHS